MTHNRVISMSYAKVLWNRDSCTTCAIISAGVSRFFPPQDTSSDFFRPWRRYRRGDEITLTWDWIWHPETIQIKTGNVDTDWPSLSFHCFGKGSDLPLLSSPKAYVDDTRSEASLHWMQFWIMKCTTEHEHCNRIEPQALPDRILDLGLSGDSTIRLMDTQNQLGYYACLSHRWSSDQPLRTLKENIESFKSGIPIEALPKTFREAVSVCRRLSLRYLWIDSLCITQDSPEEKQRQLPKMASIYENSLLTIAATKASGHQGLHAEEDEERVYLEYISASELGHGLVEGIWVRLAYPNRGIGINHWHDSTNKEHEQEWPLLTRAWVFQERLLSPRMLLFAKRELVWECRTCVSCDCGKNHDKPSDDLEFRRLVTSQSIKTSDVTPMQLRYLWYAITQRYSQVMGNLTYESDVFPALSGLASRISGLLNDEYVAGLWRSSIVEGLLWTRDDEHGCRKDGRPKEWRAPSWSWASIVGEIVYQHKGRSYFGSELQEIYANAVNVYCDPTGLDRTGTISSAVLTLSGWTSPAAVRIRRTKRRSMWSDEPIIEVSHTLIRYHSGDGTRFVPDHPEEMIDGTVVLCMRLAKIGGHDWYMVLGKESPTSTNYKRLGLLEGENVTWSWFSPASWRRRAEERFHEEKKVVYVV